MSEKEKVKARGLRKSWFQLVYQEEIPHLLNNLIGHLAEESGV